MKFDKKKVLAGIICLIVVLLGLFVQRVSSKVDLLSINTLYISMLLIMMGALAVASDEIFDLNFFSTLMPKIDIGGKVGKALTWIVLIVGIVLFSIVMLQNIFPNFK